MVSRVIGIGLFFCLPGLIATTQARTDAPEDALDRFFSSPVQAASFLSPGSPGERAAAKDTVILPIPEDTLLQVTNRGATRIFVNVNGSRFKLAADSAEVARSANTFPIPRSGAITINIADFLQSDDENYAGLTVQGPPETDAGFLFANVLFAGQEIAYEISKADLKKLPETLSLLESYPNPFREQATIRYQVPEDRTTGLDVRLVVYDVLGRRIATLVDGRRYPGTFTVTWNGRSNGRSVASGVYFGHLVAGGTHRTIEMVLVR